MIKRLGKIYTVISVNLFTIILILVFINLVAFLGFRFKTFIKGYLGDVNPIYEKYGEAVQRAYPGWKKLDVNRLLDETWKRPPIYESITQFKERPFKGKFVNVDEAGFRYGKNQGPWPPKPKSFNVFVFGGSTTFGYGVPDDQTVPSYLQEHLRNKGQKNTCVYNFARGYYFSTQELLLLEKLIINGFVPDMAVFIDGLNEFYYAGLEDLPWTPALRRCTDRSIFEVSRSLFSLLPLSKAIGWASKRLGGANDDIAPRDKAGDFKSKQGVKDLKLINSAIGRYKKNRKMIEAVARVNNIKLIFVWQPVPAYKLDLKHHLFFKGSLGGHEISYIGYVEMEKKLRQGEFGNSFLWCADIQEGLTETLYVDEVHYSAFMGNKLAARIVEMAGKKNLLAR